MDNKVPLYIRAQQGLQGEIQMMDKKTLKWLFQTAKPKKTEITDIYPKYISVSDTLYEKYKPRSEWFAKKEILGSIHGIRHVFREIILAGVLYQLYSPNFELSDLLLCSLVHDLRRINDNVDEGHGKRAAEWLLFNQSNFSPIHNLEMCLDAVSNHDVLTTENLSNELLKYLKAADALDRYRQPKEKWWPKKEYFLIEIDDSLLEFAKYFTYVTEAICLDMSSDNYINEILMSAVKLKLIKK